MSHALDSARGIVVVRRLAAGGAVDSTFAGTGSAIVDFQGGNGIPVGLFVRRDGKIVLVARSGPAGSSAVSNLSFARLLESGAADSSFGTNGIVVTQHLLSEAAAEMLRDGRILIAGRGSADGFLLHNSTQISKPLLMAPMRVVHIRIIFTCSTTGFGR